MIILNKTNGSKFMELKNKNIDSHNLKFINKMFNQNFKINNQGLKLLEYKKIYNILTLESLMINNDII